MHHSTTPVDLGALGNGFLSESVAFRIVRINDLTLENKIPLNCVVVL